MALLAELTNPLTAPFGLTTTNDQPVANANKIRASVESARGNTVDDWVKSLGIKNWNQADENAGNYEKGEYCLYGARIYLKIHDSPTTTTLTGDLPNPPRSYDWAGIAWGFHSIDEWESGYVYHSGEIVRYATGGLDGFYLAISATHLARADRNPNEDTIRWVKISNYVDFKGEFYINTGSYRKGDWTYYDGRFYIAKMAMTQPSVYPDRDSGNWEAVGGYRGSWVSAGTYTKGDHVFQGNRFYTCLTDVSGITDYPATDATHWAADNIFRGAWSVGANYLSGDMTLNDGHLWICSATHTPADNPNDYGPAVNRDYWDPISSFRGVYNSTTYYNTGDGVLYDGKFWLANPPSTDAFVRGLIPSLTTTKWKQISNHSAIKTAELLNALTGTDRVSFNSLKDIRRYKWRGDWTAAAYTSGDMVEYGGYVYVLDGGQVASTSAGPNTNTQWKRVGNWADWQVRDLLAGLTGDDRLSYTALKDRPTIPAARTDAEIRGLVGGMMRDSGATDVTYNQAAGTITITSTDTNTQRSDESIRDVVVGLLAEGSNVTISHDDNSDTLTISAMNTYPSNEQIRELVASFITAGSNITATHDDAGNTLTISSDNTQRTDEQIQDVVGAMFRDGTNTSVVYDTQNNTIRVNSSGGTGSTVTDEQIQDVIGDMFRNGTNTTVVYDDDANIIKINATDTNTQRDDDSIRTVIRQFLTEGNNITFDYDSQSNTFTVNATAGTSGATTFAALSDTPASLSGHGNKHVVVNSGGNALTFINAPAVPASWAQDGNTADIPASKIPSSFATDAEVDSDIATAIAPFKTQSQIEAIVAAEVEDWAQDGDVSLIPASKLTNAPQPTIPDTNLGVSQVDDDTVTVTSSTGTNAVIAKSTSTRAGVITAQQTQKLEGYPDLDAGSNGQVVARKASQNGYELINLPTQRSLDDIQDIVGAMVVGGNNVAVNYDDDAGTIGLSVTVPAAPEATPTDLSKTVSATGVTVVSSTGTNTMIGLASATLAGLFAPAEKTKLSTLDANRQLPDRGAVNQILGKSSATDYATTWVDPFTAADARSTIAAFLQAGTGITFSHDTVNNTFTLNVTAPSIAWADLTSRPNILSKEETRDLVAMFLDGGDGITITHDDPGNTLTIEADVGWSDVSDKPSFSGHPDGWTTKIGGYINLFGHNNDLLLNIQYGSSSSQSAYFTVPQDGMIRITVLSDTINGRAETAACYLRRASSNAQGTAHIFAQGYAYNQFIRFWTDSSNRLMARQTTGLSMANTYIMIEHWDDGSFRHSGVAKPFTGIAPS